MVKTRFIRYIVNIVNRNEQKLVALILSLLFSGKYLVDDYVLVAKDKHGYNVEQVFECGKLYFLTGLIVLALVP